MSLSVIIPLARGETDWRALVERLVAASELEVLVVSPEAVEVPTGARLISSPAGRAVQLNAGAAAASGRWLWFLHADSEVSGEAIKRARELSRQNRTALYYFDLRFRQDGPPWMFLNEWGVRFRTHWLRMPFGDQGFLLPRSLWTALGGFRADVAYGEDHVFAWAAIRAGIAVLSTGVCLSTSARKYRRHGWWRTTCRHLTATYRQAFREYARTLRLSHPFRKHRAAVAIWVKTPGLSPIKTRLALSTDPGFASRFYELAVEALRGLALRLREDGLAQPYWAVAEASGLAHPWWQGLATVEQGEGELGARLAHVYETLLARYTSVVFVGCDCPHLTSADISRALTALETFDFVFGPAADGGFYLFGGRRPIETGAWQSVAYSTNSTMRDLASVLRGIGTITYLETKTDVDSAEDLARLTQEVNATELSSPQQQRALHSILGLVASRS